jgi:hypothetical protein
MVLKVVEEPRDENEMRKEHSDRAFFFLRDKMIGSFPQMVGGKENSIKKQYK